MHQVRLNCTRMNGHIPVLAGLKVQIPAKSLLGDSRTSFFCNSTLAFFLLNQDMPNDFLAKTKQPQTFACDVFGKKAAGQDVAAVRDGAGRCLDAGMNEYFPGALHTAPDWQASCCMNSEVLDGSLLPQTFAY